jgi:hypothetical protein
LIIILLLFKIFCKNSSICIKQVLEINLLGFYIHLPLVF